MTGHKIFTADVSVRFRDLDAMGHVNNTVFLTYFEEGRKEFFAKLLGAVTPECYKVKYSFILANINCDFLKPIKMNDSISVQIWISALGTKKFHFKYKLLDKNDESIVYAKGESVQVFFDYKNSRSMDIPKSFLEEVSEYVSM